MDLSAECRDCNHEPLCEGCRLDVLYYRRITDAQVQNKRIESITLEDSRQPDEETLIQVKAKQFIDCSYEEI